MCDLRPTEKEKSEIENDVAFRRGCAQWQVILRPIFQSHLVLRLFTARYCIECCIDLKQAATT